MCFSPLPCYLVHSQTQIFSSAPYSQIPSAIYDTLFPFCSALDKIIVHGYKALQLQYFFTAGPDEVKAWTIQVRRNIHLSSIFSEHNKRSYCYATCRCGWRLNHPVSCPGILFGGVVSTNSFEDRENGDLGGGNPLVRSSGGSCNLVQEISFHIVKFSKFLVL